jgi:hypothetical protein
MAPLREAQARSDQQAGSLVKLADQMEQERPAIRAEGQVAQLEAQCDG